MTNIVHGLAGLCADWHTDIPEPLRPTPTIWSECVCGWKSYGTTTSVWAQALYAAHMQGPS